MNKECCKGYRLIAHLLSVGGIYLLAGGLLESMKVLTVLKSPIFWGLFLILAGFHCVGMMHKKK